MIVIDDFLDDQTYSDVISDGSFFPESMGLGEKIAEEVNSYHYEQSSCFAPYMFWDGWWRSPADTLKKRVIEKIWKARLPADESDILGIEYWTRTFTAGQYLDLHVDEDTFLYESSKVFRGPIAGSVYYGIDNSAGGFLEIHSATRPLVDDDVGALERENIDKIKQPLEGRERIAYRGNRLVIFDSGHILHATTPANFGIRQVMVTNVWHKSNPPLALSNGSFYYE